MSKYIYVLVALFVLFGLWLWTKIQTANKLITKVLAPEQVRFNLSNVTISWMQPVKITNPTNTGILIRLVQFNILVKGAVLSEGFLSETFVIKSLSENIVKVPCSVSVLDLLQVLPDIVQQASTNKLIFDLQGNVNAEGFTVAIESQAVVNIPNLTSIFNLFKKK